MTLRADNIQVDFGGLRALDDVTVVAEPGKIFSVVGPNGSGKSTLFNVITGLVRQTAGTVSLLRNNISGNKPHERIRMGITRTFQTPRMHPRMTLEQTIRCGMSSKMKSGVFEALLTLPRNRREEQATTERVESVLTGLGLADRAGDLMGEFPMGIVRLVDVGRAAVSRPSYILLDEPAAGLSAEEQGLLRDQILKLAENKVGVLLVEHNFRFVMEVADEVMVLDRGAMITYGDPEEVSRGKAFRTAYLGSFTSDEPEQRNSQRVVDVNPSLNQKDDTPKLVCRGLSARYGTIQVCFDIDLDARRQEVLAVLGANGAGKSSLLGALAGLVSASGTIQFDGSEIQGWPAHKRSSHGIALVPEMRGNIFPSMSVTENIDIAIRTLPHDAKREKRQSLLEMFPRLADRRKALASMLSGGEQQMLAIGMALCQGPKLLLLDEPTQGLAPAVYDTLIEVIENITAQGIAVVLAEQNLKFAERLADRFLVIAGGVISHQGDREGLQDHDHIMQAYLGKNK